MSNAVHIAKLIHKTCKFLQNIFLRTGPPFMVPAKAMPFVFEAVIMPALILPDQADVSINLL